MNPVFWLLCLIDLCLKVWTSPLSQSHSYAPISLSSMEQMQSDSTNTNGYNLLRGDVERERLTVIRGLSAPLLHVHLPIQMRAQKGEVCRVEVEEFQPLLSMVGHLEPKKFDCSFANGEVIYHHEGNPLTNQDHVQVTIFFFRNNNSVVQTVDIMVEVVDEKKPDTKSTVEGLWKNVTLDRSGPAQPHFQNHTQPRQRVLILRHVNVTSLKPTSDSISPEILRITYDPMEEECRLTYTSPEYWIVESENPDLAATVGKDGTVSPRFGLPLAAGSAVGGARRWPLFGQVVAFNRSAVPYFDHDCQEALLQGYRYMHRKAGSPATDYIPMQVRIWRRLTNGTRSDQWRQGFFLPVTIFNGQPIRRPVARTFRQVNVSHIGGSLSILPRDSISVPHDANPGLEYLDVNMTRMQGPLQAQVVNLRDPTRPVTSFRLADLRNGLVALQLLNYAESLVKVFIITLTVVDPFFQVSEPVNLKIATFLQPIIPISWNGANMARAPTFQVFSLPLFTYTGAVSLVQKHNIQVVGYIDESAVVYTVQPWSLYTTQLSRMRPVDSSSSKSKCSLHLDGEPMDGTSSFGPQHIASMRVTYVHTGNYEPTVERVPLLVTVPSLTNDGRMKRVKRAAQLDLTKRFGNRRGGKRQGGARGRGTGVARGQRYRRRPKQSPAELHLELSIRVVRLYDRVINGALQSGVTFRVPAYSYVCLRAEDLLTVEVLRAVRSDLINLSFDVKVAPSQGVLVRRWTLRRLMLLRPDHRPILTNKMFRNHQLTSTSLNEHVELAITEERLRLEKAQLGSFQLADLEWSDVCYVNQRRDRTSDLVGLKQVGRHDFPTVYMNIEIAPPAALFLKELMDPNVILRVQETAPHVVITPLHLNYATEQMSHQDTLFSAEGSSGHFGSRDDHSGNDQTVVYTVTQSPRFADLTDELRKSWTHEAGRLVSLSAVTASSHVGDMKLQPGLATSLREAQAPSVIQFTQRQINEGDIIYVPPTADIGVSDRFVTAHYTVSCPGGVRLPDRRLRILLVAVDNQTPTIEVVKPLEVQRDGELSLSPQVLAFHDVDTPNERLTVQFERLPRYGQILITLDPARSNSSELGSVGRKLPARWFNKGQIRYRQSGINVKLDDFILTVTDGIQTSQALRVPLLIRPRVLHERKWNQLVNHSILIPENGTETLYPTIFPSLETEDGVDPASLNSGAPQYFLIVFPTKGHLILDGKGQAVSQFSYEDIHKGRLAYRHGPAEIGLKPVFDFARIWDFNAGKTFSLNFTLIPVNSQPPLIKTEAPLQVKEGGRAIINQYTLYATDPDTEEKDILIQIIHAPRWGHIGLAEDLTSPSTSVMAEVPVTPAAQTGGTESGELVTETQKQPVVELKHTLSFTMEAVKQGLVYYINSRHADGQESLEDVFSVRAYDGSLQSPHTVEVKVAIQPTNDEIPQVRLLKHISVTAGSRRILTPFLFSVSDRDVPRDRLQIQFTQLPIYGNLTVYWQHGEQYTITKDSPPITESYLGMMNVIYVQNKSLLEIPSEGNLKPGSLLTVDQFTVSVNDGEHVVERQSQILIRPPNQKPPELLVDPDATDGIVLDGRSWTRLDHRPGGLVIHDNDTADDDLVLTLVETPKYGLIQRLPRLDGSGGVDLLDLVEDAWDLEESRAAEDVQALSRLAVAGSTGGPKAVKSLKQGDRFTKRQIETGRIHYVYTGTYTSRYVYDSCVLRLTDGAYETAAISLRFRIRNAKGGVGVQTLRYSPADHLQQQLRALQYPDVDTTEMLKSPSSAARSLIMVNHPKSTADDLNYKQQMDQSALADTIQVTFEYPSVEAHLNEFIFLNMDHLNPESIHTTTSGQFRAPQAFIFYLVGEFRSSGVGVSSLVGTLNPLPCSISLVDAHKPNENMTEIAYRDISMRRIALSARDCQSKLDQTVRLLFRCETITSDPQIQTESPTYVTVPVKITKKRRALPHLEQAGPVQVLSGADWLVGSDQLLCSDRDTKPTHLIYTVVSSLSSDSSRQLGSLVVANNESSRIFTQHQVNTGQVVFVASNGVNMVNTDVQVIELQLFDAGEFDRVFDPQELIRTAEQALVVLKTHGTTEFNPYLERLQYTWNDAAPTVTIKPIRLEIRPNPLLFSQDIQMDPLRMLVQKSPKPNALETLLPGRTGFRLTAANLYVFHAGTIYTLTDIQGAACELFDLSETRPTRQFAQQALNRRLVAVLIKDASKQVQNETPTSVQLTFELSNPGISPVKRTHSLILEWTTIGFVRRVYRVCAERGLLSLAVRRDGPSAALKASSVDAYVGLTSETAIEGRDFSLHSQKLLTFQMGETRQTILIRLHPAEQTAQRKLVFHVDLKSPTGTVLDSNRRATVVIRPGPKCKHRSYFSPQQHENPVKRDLAIMDETVSEQGLSATHDVKSHDFADPIMLSSAIRSGELTPLGKPISLAEWLATNQLPDSQTLSASYEQYLISQQTNKCVKGWHYFENRCYRFYSGSALTTWNKARLQCERQDAFLTSITSDRHAVWVKDTFGIHEPFWIGLHQPYPGSIWIWHNLERVGYTNWESGFPVDAKWNREMGHGSDVHTAHSSKKRPKRPTVTPRMLDLESVFRIQNDLYTQPRAMPYGHVFRVPRRVPIGKDSPDNSGTGKGPRACVLANTSLFWQNRPCHRFLRSGYVCMRNPEV